jgi:hypothetical protein
LNRLGATHVAVTAAAQDVPCATLTV